MVAFQAAEQPGDPTRAEELEARTAQSRNPLYPKDPMGFAPRPTSPHDLARPERYARRYKSACHREHASGARAILNGLASNRFEPPLPPLGKGMEWDQHALQRREAHIAEGMHLKRLLSEQATQRAFLDLQRRLRQAETAEAAVVVLEEMKVALGMLLSRLPQPGGVADHLASLKLRFERLVRNVWVEGADVHYDRLKAEVCQLLREEDAKRNAVVVEHVPPAAPRPLRQLPALVDDLRMQQTDFSLRRAAAAEASAPMFKGMKVEHEKPTSVAHSQRVLMSSLRRRTAAAAS